MNIGITGCSGMLGSSFANFFKSNKINYFPVDRKHYSINCDINYIVKYFKSKKTTLIIHCAANTDVEFCEKNPRQCFNDNVELTKNLLITCKKLDIKFVFISSTGVYGDYKKTPYNESDFTKPKTIYHQSKLLAENEIIDKLENYIIIRTGWLFGGNKNSKKNFVRNRLIEAQDNKDIIKSNIEQYGNPTFTEDVVINTHSLIKYDHSGLYNCVNKGFASRYEYVNEILKNDGRKNKIEPVRKSEFNRLANVSNNEMANNKNLNKIGLNKMPDWKKSLKKYMSNTDF
tara:strand:+ start:1365 stop:2225 length:861 start_codon:yes stop_codon:yes gene_type:complete